ncbi:c-type cytochrome [Stieleria sp. JC731]|uniref:c-type cytochrome n=1 Tax=Pirellulaceae TaxID=2691357 RepID=UPI001E3FE30A|nr:c-type cytochrome [Stieleria sp. JC731]MCC9600705.1 c-type cytochrome [Stieleria sp. JC731]
MIEQNVNDSGDVLRRVCCCVDHFIVRRLSRQISMLSDTELFKSLGDRYCMALSTIGKGTMVLIRVLLVLLLLLFTAVLNSGTRSVAKEAANPSSQVDLPQGELRRVVALGKEIVESTATHPLSKDYVGNSLTCRSCHLDAGTDPKAATFLGVATAYPAWSPRENRVITLEDRVLNCFMRSLNGERPPNGSELSVAITSYITWLSRGEPLKMNPEAPLGPRHVQPLSIGATQADGTRGGALYAEHCAACHGEGGAGTADGPPVWGENSYNDGAGLSQVNKLAAWLKVAMPLDDPYLSEQEALDIAAFVNSQPRPKFILDRSQSKIP